MGNKFYTYVLKSEKDGRIYIGHTNNIKSRLELHNEGMVISTRNRRPFKLILKEIYETRSEAYKREQYLKSGQGREWLHKYLVACPPSADLRTCNSLRSNKF